MRYGEKYGNEGLWNGSLYVFDDRKSIDFAPDARVLGTCFSCSAPTNRMENCSEPSCREQLVVCDLHADTTACELHRAA